MMIAGDMTCFVAVNTFSSVRCHGRQNGAAAADLVFSILAETFPVSANDTSPTYRSLSCPCVGRSQISCSLRDLNATARRAESINLNPN